jgi:flagellum-specific peptidoglycan hydrolase FlgJ
MSKLYTCTVCNKKKQPHEFYINKSGDKKGKIVNYCCKACSAIKRNGVSEEQKQQQREYLIEYNRVHHQEIKDKRSGYFEQYYIDNKEKQAEQSKSWRDNNPDLNAAKEARRRSRKLQRTPSWMTKDEESKIKSIYKMCRAISKKTGIPHQVDHIIPLQGKVVSGLHTITNLQIITQTENIRKHNKLIEDMI